MLSACGESVRGGFLIPPPDDGNRTGNCGTAGVPKGGSKVSFHASYALGSSP